MLLVPAGKWNDVHKLDSFYIECFMFSRICCDVKFDYYICFIGELIH